MKVKVKIVNLNAKKFLLPSGNKRRGRYHENNYLGSDKWAQISRLLFNWFGLTARHSTELMTTAVIPRAPVAMAISALIPPAILDLLSPLSMQHLRIHPSTYGNKAFFISTTSI